jgi:putative membrane protein
MYLWLKALHIIFMVSWFAGIFYLPRLFVNIQLSDNPAVKQHLNQMAHKLYRFITPFMYLTLIFGGWLAALNWSYFQTAGWFHAKLALVVALIVYHHFCGYYRKQLQAGTCQKSHVFFRFFNEAPVLILFAVVLLVVLKPF